MASEGRLWAFEQDRVERAGHVHNAIFHLEMLRATIHDGLTNGSDIYLKVALISDLDAAQDDLRKALA